MKNFYVVVRTCILLFFMACSFTGRSQYYYKDIISTSQINENFRLYTINKVTGVKLNTFNGSTPITEGFICEQKVSYRPNKVVTYTKTSDAGESFLTAIYNAQGLLVKSTDSTEETVSTSSYEYDANRRLIQLKNNTRATDNSSATVEIHNWVYNSAGKPLQMIRIKNGNDSIVVKFTLDEKGNPAEEEAFHKNSSQGKIYYYYDENNRLTDVVRYNIAAKRLLPDYIFEYEDNGQVSVFTIVPEGSTDYQKWYYKYDDNGLKLADFCYNKKNVLQGKVEYEYAFGR